MTRLQRLGSVDSGHRPSRRSSGRRRSVGIVPWLEGLEARTLMATITEYPIPGANPNLGNGLIGITGGPDGNVYFTDTLNNAIGQVTPSGVITEPPSLSEPFAAGGFLQKNGLDGIRT